MAIRVVRSSQNTRVGDSTPPRGATKATSFGEYAREKAKKQHYRASLRISWGNPRRGMDVGVILHAREEWISELEVYPIPNVKGPFNLPSIESLRQV